MERCPSSPRSGRRCWDNPLRRCRRHRHHRAPPSRRRRPQCRRWLRWEWQRRRPKPRPRREPISVVATDPAVSRDGWAAYSRRTASPRASRRLTPAWRTISTGVRALRSSRRSASHSSRRPRRRLLRRKASPDCPPCRRPVFRVSRCCSHPARFCCACARCVPVISVPSEDRALLVWFPGDNSVRAASRCAGFQAFRAPQQLP